MAESRRFRITSVTGAAPALPMLLLLALAAVDGLDKAMFGALLPEIRDWFGVSLRTALGFQAFAALLIIALAIPIGYLCDRVNRVRLTVVAGLLWGVMTFLTGVAPTLVLLYVARFGAGLTGAVGPAHNSLLSDYYPPETRTGVFSVFGAAGPIGAFVGPIVGGYLAARFTWQTPFVVFAIPSIALSIVIAVKLREPARGGQERRSLGLDETAEPAPPSFAETWRIARSVRTLRRIFWAMPFLAGGVVALGNFLGVYFDEVFHLGTAARGNVVAANQPFLLVGLAVGALLGNRMLQLRPSRLVTYVGLIGVAQAVTIGFVAIAPTWWLAVIPLYLGTAAGAVLSPALFSLLSLVIPPRVRGGALGFAAVFLAPGLLLAPFMGQISDSFGTRWGIAASIPFFLIGSAIIATAGVSIDADIRQARAAAAAGIASSEEGRPILVVRDVDVHFGGVQILFGVDLDVQEGEILALLGTNGAGKSTLLRAIAGTVTPSSGAVFFDGNDVTFLPPSVHATHGIAQVQGGKGVFPNLTVSENIRLAAWGMDAKEEDVEAAIDLFPILRERSDQFAASLSGGEQQMLALAQAFLARPRLLVIDELSLGLAPTVVNELLKVVRQIHAQGATVVIVEQNINTALELAERAVFMEKGQVRFTGPTRDLLDRPDVLRSVFLAGGSRAVAGSYGNRRPDAAATSAAPALEVRNLSKTFGGVRATNDVSFSVARGEILGLIGPNGAGKTTLFDLISGFEFPDAGEVILDGADVTALPMDQRARLGLHRSFQDARLFPSLTVFEAVCVALEKHVDVRSPFPAALHLPTVRKSERRLAARAERLVDLIGLGPHRDKFLRELSTGTRRLVDLASVIATEPSVLLLDEPAAGIAQKETEQLGPIIERIRFEVGCAIIIIEHDLPLVSAVSDELLALVQGAVVTRGAPATVLDDPRVVSAYVGTK